MRCRLFSFIHSVTSLVVLFLFSLVSACALSDENTAEPAETCVTPCLDFSQKILSRT